MRPEGHPERFRACVPPHGLLIFAPFRVSVAMANVAQLVELQIVVLAVAGSSPVIRPILRQPFVAFPHESLSVTVRLNTGAPGLDARVSAQK